MTDILTTIRSRGYWRVALRPATFQPERVERLGALVDAVRSSRVDLTGWPYPYISDVGPRKHGDYIEDSVSWAHYHELWRLYQSGQYVHLFAMPEDWYADSELAMQLRSIVPGSVLDLQATLYTMTEFFLFASRLTESLDLGPTVVVSYRLFALAGRELQTLDPRRVPLFRRRAADDLTDFGREIELSADQLVAESLSLAVHHTFLIYERFGWEPSQESLAEQQRQFLERRI